MIFSPVKNFIFFICFAAVMFFSGSVFAFTAGTYKVYMTDAASHVWQATSPDPYVSCSTTTYPFPAGTTFFVHGDGATFFCAHTTPIWGIVDAAYGGTTYTFTPAVPVCVAPDTLVNNVCVAPVVTASSVPVTTTLSGDVGALTSAINLINSSFVQVSDPSAADIFYVFTWGFGAVMLFFSLGFSLSAVLRMIGFL